jgi:cytochrome c oxidase subunit 4
MAHPTVTPRTYLVVYAVLIGLTVTTYWVALNLHLGAWEVPVALGIAITKTVLVGLFFMHLLYSSRLVWLVIAVAVVFFLILWAFTWADYYTRPWLHDPGPPSAVTRTEK